MTAQLVTVNLPEALHLQLETRARLHQRSVADEVLDLLVTAVPVADELPEELEQAISPQTLLDDTELWRAARTRLASEAAERLELLHQKRQREGLTESEEQERASLMQYERAMLVRAQAAAQQGCGYCLTREEIVGTPMELVHLIQVPAGVQAALPEGHRQLQPGLGDRTAERRREARVATGA